MHKAFIILLKAGLVLFATGAAWEGGSRVAARRRYPVAGRMVDIGGRAIQLDCRGTGSPTVVLESGLDVYGSLAWAAVHDSMAATTRTCAYSRAGILWSEAAPGDFSSARVASDLHAALTVAGERAPFVMVGHSIGGPYILAYTHAYPHDVAGLVFVDPSHPDQFSRFRQITGRRMEPPTGVVTFGAAMAWTGIVRLLPSEPVPQNWPAVLNGAPAAFLASSVEYDLPAETRAVDATLLAARQDRNLGDRPLIVLSAGAPMGERELRLSGITREQSRRMQDTMHELHADLARWSSSGRQEVVPNSTHYIQLEQPSVVIRAVRDVVLQVRTRHA